MVQITVLKVRLSCEKDRRKLMKSISTLCGVDKIEIDTAKETITVTGDADPFTIITRARKVMKCIEIMTVGPPPKKPEEKKPEETKKPCILPPCTYMPRPCDGPNIFPCGGYNMPPPCAVVRVGEEYPCTTCSIM
ncbi:hypothetical protein SSX86_019196 [Deinandra increscens subsp. villosa]|uniref:HMA domain-containing protein n=1 Tax=Deinandra increscens subsp. villosa TaxID=3103831 RepID=A0AAP0CXG1_9ASTR